MMRDVNFFSREKSKMLEMSGSSGSWPTFIENLILLTMSDYE